MAVVASSPTAEPDEHGHPSRWIGSCTGLAHTQRRCALARWAKCRGVCAVSAAGPGLGGGFSGRYIWST